MVQSMSDVHPTSPAGEVTGSRISLIASLVISSVAILFSLWGIVWADGQRINYEGLNLGRITRDVVEGYGTPQSYIPVYLLLMGVAGGVALLLALIGAKSCAAAPIRAVIAGAMAAAVLTVPFAVLALYVISHWSNGD